VRLERIRERLRVKAAREKKFWEKRHARHLLTGLASAALAAVIWRRGKDYLACSGARRQRTCSNRKSVRRPQLESVNIDALEGNLIAPELVEEFAREFHAEVNRQRHDVELSAELKWRELTDVSRKLEQLIDAITERLPAPGRQLQLDELTAKKADLEKAVADIRISPRSIIAS
jgi:site-specific DNA recombinase